MAAISETVDAASIEHALSGSAHTETKWQNRFTKWLHLWHLLSLDAPAVAMLWTWFLARSSHIFLPVSAVFAMGVAVWMLYAADRLLDTRKLDDPTSTVVILSRNTSNGSKSRVSLDAPAALKQADLEPRHYFHHRHQVAFRLAIFFAAILLAMLLPSLAPQSIHLFLALGTLLFGYFILIHISPSVGGSKTHRMPKEIAVGVFFSAAAFVPTVARNPTLRLALLPAAVLFAALCSLNCLFIYAWEHPATSCQTNSATRIALRILPHLAVATAVAGLLMCSTSDLLPRRIPTACSLAALLLLLLNRNSHRLAPTTLRASADLCLLTPLLLLHF